MTTSESGADAATRPGVLFPGQGAQALGMAVDLVEARPEARAVFDRGREVLGFDVLEVCRDGPQETLDSTRVSQPAIFLHSMALLEIIGGAGTFGAGIDASVTAGLSLGEYSALVFAGSLAFEDALRLVGRRGELMQEACDATEGTMVSVLGLAADAVEEVVAAEAAGGARVGVANYNSPAQTVISGEVEAVRRAAEKLREAGARKAVELRVAGAYHSPLMESATRGMEPLLREVRIESPRIPFWANAFGERVEDPERIREGLIRQIEGSVRWSQILAGMIAGGLGAALEIGPGKVLQGLVRGVDRSVSVESIGTLEALDKSDRLPL